VRFGLDFPIVGDFSDTRILAELALEAEKAEWDGCFVWDHLQISEPTNIADPWIALGLMALSTQRIQLGTLVTPVARRNPWKLARETLTLDQLSRGRLVLGVGLGSDVFGEISSFAGPLQDKVRSEILDEALVVLTGLWSGRPLSFAGRHFRVEAPSFLSAGATAPRIPVWIGATGSRKAPLRRAARFNGVVPVVGDMHTVLSPEQLGTIVDYIKNFRAQDDDKFDAIHLANPGRLSGARDSDLIQAYAAAGATWWLVAISPSRNSVDEVRRWIQKGPPGTTA
jgi:alkanesulfonate monooxygenase SsuD/methylene tetrahydromethanopterin reductase-like flavin-dependent oxidoreductase (luciferase family)